MTIDFTRQIDEAVSYLRAVNGDQFPEIMIVAGSGLGSVADMVENPKIIPYRDIPHFPDRCSVHGHKGQLVFGTLHGHHVVIMQGRFHPYEALPKESYCLPFYAMKKLGLSRVILTNAVGSLLPDLAPGNVAFIKDHINYMGFNPTVGEHPDDMGPRFFSMADAYDPDMRADLQKCAEMIDLGRQKEVTFIGVMGPNFETAAEIRFFQQIGADIVGMSVIHEALICRKIGIKVACISNVTNFGQGMFDEHLSHDHTLNMATEGAYKIARILDAYFKNLKG